MAPTAEDKRFYKIGEVCKLADVQPYVLRYWETEFPALAPNKSGGGQRLYSRREIDIILRIKQLLYSEGFTIAGAKKRLDTEPLPSAEEQPLPAPPVPTRAAQADGAGASGLRVDILRTVRSELTAILDLLRD